MTKTIFYMVDSYALPGKKPLPVGSPPKKMNPFLYGQLEQDYGIFLDNGSLSDSCLNKTCMFINSGG